MDDVAAGGEGTGSRAWQSHVATKVRISSAMNNVMTILYQNTKADLFDGRLSLSKLNYKSNLGVIIAAMLSALGFAWSETGKRLWRRAEPDGMRLLCVASLGCRP